LFDFRFSFTLLCFGAAPGFEIFSEVGGFLLVPKPVLVSKGESLIS